MKSEEILQEVQDLIQRAGKLLAPDSKTVSELTAIAVRLGVLAELLAISYEYGEK